MKITYANVFVSDLDSAVVFYRDVLGLEPKLADAAHGYASFSAGPISLGLAMADPGQRELIGRHTGLGFAVDDLLKEHDRLSVLGVQFTMPPSRQMWGGFMAMFQDPDGNVFYLDEVAAAHG